MASRQVCRPGERRLRCIAAASLGRLPLTEIAELGKLDPALPATLDENGAYTKATEDHLLQKWGQGAR